MKPEEWQRVLVCGGRDFKDWQLLYSVLDALRPKPIRIIHGCARGADSLAGAWARVRGVSVHEFPAQWKERGPVAGPMRNQEMLERGEPDLVIAFPGGRGTADMVRRAEGAGVPVTLVPPSSTEPRDAAE